MTGDRQRRWHQRRITDKAAYVAPPPSNGGGSAPPSWRARRHDAEQSCPLFGGCATRHIFARKLPHRSRLSGASVQAVGGSSAEMWTAERHKRRWERQAYSALQRDQDARPTDVVLLATIFGIAAVEIILMAWLCR
jgi:hypothetical protein